jgi:hypothetical protein
MSSVRGFVTQRRFTPGNPSPHKVATADVVCLSHLRWGFVFQRPQHLMTRFARDRRVFFIEEPLEADGAPHMVVHRDSSGVYICVPHVPADLPGDELVRLLRGLVDRLLSEQGSDDYVLWYLTPMALPFTRHLHPVATAFDCMDELAAFAFAPAELVSLERELLARADIVFTGGRSLHEARRTRHGNVHCHPSSVDVAHFAQARGGLADPPDQRALPHPRLGYVGVIDERMDFDLIDEVAALRPQWHLILVGPLAKVEAAAIPDRANVHLLGAKPYSELPAYLAHWDLAMLPFARNDATRFISPTKTPEYLAAGRRVVSTSISDVVTPFGELGMVHIADDPAAFVSAVEAAWRNDGPAWLLRVDGYLAGCSWERTFSAMQQRLDAVVSQRRGDRVQIDPNASHTAAPAVRGALSGARP